MLLFLQRPAVYSGVTLSAPLSLSSWEKGEVQQVPVCYFLTLLLHPTVLTTGLVPQTMLVHENRNSLDGAWCLRSLFFGARMQLQTDKVTRHLRTGRKYLDGMDPVPLQLKYILSLECCWSPDFTQLAQLGAALSFLNQLFMIQI